MALASPRTFGLAAVVALLALSVSCAAPPTEGTGAPPIGELGVPTQTPATAKTATPADTQPTTTFAPATATTGAPTSADGVTCTSRPVDVAIDPAQDPAAHLPATAAWGTAPIPGSRPLLADPAGPSEARRFDVRGVGVGDVVLIAVEPVIPTDVALVVVGHLDPAGRTFRRIAVLDDCRTQQVRSDDQRAWLLASDTTGADVTLLELALDTGTTNWSRDADHDTRWIGVENGVVHLAMGDGEVAPARTITIAAGTGDLIGTADVAEPIRGRIIESDAGLWVIEDDRTEIVRYRRIDPSTGTATADLDVSTLDAAGEQQVTIWSGVLGSGIWRVGTQLERVSLVDGSVTTFPGTSTWWNLLAGIGPSGLWLVLPGDPRPDGTRDATLVHVAPGSSDVTAAAPFSLRMVRDTRSPERPDLSPLAVDGRGFVYREHDVKGLDRPSAPTWSYRAEAASPDPSTAVRLDDRADG